MDGNEGGIAGGCGGRSSCWGCWRGGRVRGDRPPWPLYSFSAMALTLWLGATGFGVMKKDFLDEIVADRTKKNPKFPDLVAEAGNGPPTRCQTAGPRLQPDARGRPDGDRGVLGQQAGVGGRGQGVDLAAVLRRHRTDVSTSGCPYQVGCVDLSPTPLRRRQRLQAKARVLIGSPRSGAQTPACALVAGHLKVGRQTPRFARAHSHSAAPA
jgi:hypothetical protein